jgi:choice-of-anchor C domain-containing protein
VKRRTGIGIVFGLVAALVLAPATMAAAFTDGSFENGTYVDGGSGFQQLDAPNTSIDGWTVADGSVDWIETYWAAGEGTKSIDMSGAEAGTLSQTFDTTIGNTYTVSFLLAGNPAGPPALKTLDVSATGGTLAHYTFDVTGTDVTTMGWTLETYSFLATSPSSTLNFISTTDGVFGPAIDAVDIAESVPVKDDCKDGGWQSMIDNTGNSFKNQGDCVSYFATKGKNLGAVPPVVVAADSTAAHVKHSTKHQDKTTVTTQTTERQHGKVKAKGQNVHGHGSKSHKSK